MEQCAQKAMFSTAETPNSPHFWRSKMAVLIEIMNLNVDHWAVHENGVFKVVNNKLNLCYYWNLWISRKWSHAWAMLF